MRVAIASDHAGLGLKLDLVVHRREPGYEVLDLEARYAGGATRFEAEGSTP